MRGVTKFFLLLIVLAFSLPIFAQGAYTAWVATYNGTSNSYDQATAIAVDDSGYVYVTGQAVNLGTGADYATFKYKPNGDIAWMVTYNGPDNAYDRAYALALDDSGNVYVSGSSQGIGTDLDFATIKYNSAGDTVWVRRYDGPGSGYDQTSAMAVDVSGNVYVTGRSRNTITGFPGADYATIKYKPNGDTAWVRRYNGPANDSVFDEATALALDDSGNVYVTGRSGYNFPSSFAGLDYATIKYKPNGDTVWVRRYNGPGNDEEQALALAADDSGNVYVTGHSTGSGTSSDYATIKYAPNGNTLWTKRYNGPGNLYDQAYDLARDANGNVYVTGASFSSTDYDFATIKYKPNGDTAWLRRYNFSSSYDGALALALDGSGNLYVTGLSIGSGTYYDYATIKYTPAGAMVWAKGYTGFAGIGDDRALALATDNSGSVCVTGYSTGSSTLTDYTTIKYAPTSTTTPIGSNVLVHPIDSLTVLFDNVTVAGITTVTTDTLGPPPPNGFQLVPDNPPVYYDIQTTATYTESLTVCLTYTQGLTSNEDSLRLLHYDGATWQDVTVSLDTAQNQICATVASLSLFALAELVPPCVAKPGDADADNGFTLADVIAIVNYIFKKSGWPACSNNNYTCWLHALTCRGEWDASGIVDLADVIRSVNYIFKKTGWPACPANNYTCWLPPALGVCCLPVP